MRRIRVARRAKDTRSCARKQCGRLRLIPERARDQRHRLAGQEPNNAEFPNDTQRGSLTARSLLGATEEQVSFILDHEHSAPAKRLAAMQCAVTADQQSAQRDLDGEQRRESRTSAFRDRQIEDENPSFVNDLFKRHLVR